MILCLLAVCGFFVGNRTWPPEHPCLAQENKTNQTTPPDYHPAPVTSLSLKGKRIFAENHCASCHSLGTGGGCLGPPLAGVGARRSKDFITARITADPSQVKKFKTLYGAQELMPHPRLPKSLSTPLVAYLMTLPQPKDGFKVGQHQQVSDKLTPAEINKTTRWRQASIIKGKRLFYERGCTACHSVYGTGGQFAPALDGVSRRRNRIQISTRINKAELLQLGPSFEYAERGTVMPPCNLNEGEIEQITDFLITLPPR